MPHQVAARPARGANLAERRQAIPQERTALVAIAEANAWCGISLSDYPQPQRRRYRRSIGDAFVDHEAERPAAFGKERQRVQPLDIDATDLTAAIGDGAARLEQRGLLAACIERHFDLTVLELHPSRVAANGADIEHLHDVAAHCRRTRRP